MIVVDEFKTCIYGYQITDCVVRSRKAFHFVGRNIEQGGKAGVMSEWKVTKRAMSFFLDEPEGSRVGTMDLTNFERVYSGACNTSDGKDQVVFVDTDGQVFTRGGGFRGMESPIPKSKHGPMRGIVERIRMIDGVLYVSGSHRSLCRRRGINDWASLCYDLPIPTQKECDDIRLLDDMSFVDVDGFNHEDIYTVGGKGVVWNLQGQHWRRCAFPSNMYMESVCCAGDGHVYIGAQSGTVFRGRGDTWKMIHRGDLTLPFKDMVWHAGRLWCTNDYGLWTLEGDRIERVQGLTSEVAVSAGNLSAADGVMLMAGTHGAAFHDGTEWHHIFNYYQMEQQLAGK